MAPTPTERRPWVMDTAPGDDEAPKDPGALQTHHLGYTEKDFEGHRAHTVYVGVHLPGQGHRRRSHRKHHKHHKNSKDSTDEDDRPITPPAQRVQFILGEDAEEGTGHETHPLFSEMGELVREGDDFEWKETARWIKFEEDVEEGGNRWSKPHVATLSLHSLFELRAMLSSGTVMLDMEASNMEQVADLTIDAMASAGHLTLEEQKEKVRDALLRKHRHQHQRRKEASSSNMARLPIIRSLAEIGRNHSSSKINDRRRSSTTSAQDGYMIDDGSVVPVTPMSMLVQQSMMAMAAPQMHGDLVLQPPKIVHQYQRYLSLPAGSGSGAASVPHEGMDHSPSSGSIPRNQSATGLSESATNGDLSQHKTNVHFMRKIPQGAEASNVLVGEVDFLEKPLSAFIRLSQATFMGDLTEVPVPTRFIFILLGPVGGSSRFHEIGRSMATLMSDEIFHDVAYKARKREYLVVALDEFLDAVTVLPPGEWDPTIRIEPPAAIPQCTRRNPPGSGKDPEVDSIEEEEDEQKQREQAGLSRTGRLWGGLRNDIKRKAPWYWSDFKDALAVQCIASWIFLYFACLSPIITFGGLLGHATGNNMAAMESLVSGFVCGMGYGFFSGQPLTILGSTGPVLVFETIMYDFCQSIGWDYLCFRFWVGIWVGIILVILVAIDASAFVCYITRFTEENFATLIAFIFIYKAIENVLKIGFENPVNPMGDMNNYLLPQNCSCAPGNSTVMQEWNAANWSSVGKQECMALNGTLMGPGCAAIQYVPDVFLMSVILFLGTFIISVILKDFKNSLFFPSSVRQVISDFGVIIAIFAMTLLDGYMKIDTPKLMVPSEFKPTLPNRGWLVSPFINPFYTIFLAPLPALLATILIFMDQQITAVIVNRKENKLKKGGGYHLDLFVLAILIMICSAMGLPWFVAATVLSINHVNSLKLESECAAPGEKPQFLGVREQRVTHIMIFAMIGLSVVMTPLLQHIPMPVLFGVFLYMGAASLKGLQFFDRILIMFMPLKYQPDYMFLRQVPLKRVHMFTAIQLTCLIALWVIKSFKKTSILFPLMLVVMIGMRKGLDFFFTRRELKILDDVMPETSKRSAAEKKHKLGVDDDDESGDMEGGQGKLPIGPSGNLAIPLANGNIMKIPLASINISEEVNKSGVWKQVNEDNGIAIKDEKKKSSSPSKNSKPRKRGSKKDALTEDERHRLSTMTEEQEEDDGGITIKKTPKHEASNGDRQKIAAATNNQTAPLAPQASMEEDEEEDPLSVTPSTPMLQKSKQQEGSQEKSNGLQEQS
ncbi:electroneutral sodium bicarbonate exchanger 1 isoform X9 [Cloeon dipterum]|uniref:electroneutral sodium bicarbonate exchanger 1 isoform X9 n=1 Tax=Cloeon dipterum TaxID=197152 RepID=UPI0032207EF6